MLIDSRFHVNLEINGGNFKRGFISSEHRISLNSIRHGFMNESRLALNDTSTLHHFTDILMCHTRMESTINQTPRILWFGKHTAASTSKDFVCEFYEYRYMRLI